MTKNLASWDRGLRVLAALFAGGAAVAAPLSLGLRLGLLASTSLYLAWSAVAGTCLGYRLMGKSTCPTATQS